MGKQFVNHDYYFVATFIGFLILLTGHLILVLQARELATVGRESINVVLLLAVIAGGIFCAQQYESRHSEYFVWRNRTILNEVEWMKNGDKKLDELGVPHEARIFVFYAFAPNTSLIYFDRRGRVFNHEEMTREPKNISYWLGRIDPQFAILPAVWHDHIKKDQPQLLEKMELVSKNQNFYLYSIQTKD